MFQFFFFEGVPLVRLKMKNDIFVIQGTVLEVNISELGLVTSGGKVVWGKYAQVFLIHITITVFEIMLS